MYENTKQQFSELGKQLLDPEIINNQKKLKEISKKHSELKEIIGLILELEKIENSAEENKEILNNENDPELKKMAEEELAEIGIRIKKLKNEIELELHPADPRDKKNAIMEIRAGTGGDESALFTAELFRMYARYAERKGWKLEILDSNRIGIGGFKEIIFNIKGKNVFGDLKYEAGTHRVQRVPETEKAGRVHTSAATVAVLAEAEEIELEIKNEDLRIDTYAASGPGGQKVNTTNSAVRITYLPKNLVVTCQDQKSQHQNKEKAMQILRSRLLDRIEEEKKEKEASERKSQIGSGDRSEKIRTYNFPQDRITDHRVKITWHSIDKIMDGDIGEIIKTLQEEDLKLRMAK
jgi:peptide chain release factor 1